MIDCVVVVQIIQIIFFSTFLFTWPRKTLPESLTIIHLWYSFYVQCWMPSVFWGLAFPFYNFMKKLHFSTPLALIFNDLLFFVHISMYFYSQIVTGILTFSKRNEKMLKYRTFKYFFTEIDSSILKGRVREKHFILSIMNISQPSFTFWVGFL